MKNKYKKLFLNIIIVILNLGLIYILLVYSIFLFWSKHADKKVINGNIINIVLFFMLILIFIITIICLINIIRIIVRRNR